MELMEISIAVSLWGKVSKDWTQGKIIHVFYRDKSGEEILVGSKIPGLHA